MVISQTKVKVSGERAKKKDSTRIRTWGRRSILTVPMPYPSQICSGNGVPIQKPGSPSPLGVSKI